MIVTANVEYVQGHLRSGHYEVNVPEKDEELFKSFTKKQQEEYIKDRSDLIIDDYSIDYVGNINDINY